MNTKAVVFDAYGTLFDVNSAAEKCKDKIEISGKLLQIFGELLSLNILGLEVLRKGTKISGRSQKIA